MGSCSIVYVGIYALIYLHTILGERIVSRDGLPRGVLPSGILKIEKYCPGLKVRFPLQSQVFSEDEVPISGLFKGIIRARDVVRLPFQKTTIYVSSDKMYLNVDKVATT